MTISDRLEELERRKGLRERLGNTIDLLSILAYLHRDVMLDMIMKCDCDEIERAINYAIRKGEVSTDDR